MHDTKLPARDPSADITDREAVHRAPQQAQCSFSKSKAWRPSKWHKQGDRVEATQPMHSHHRLHTSDYGSWQSDNIKNRRKYNFPKKKKVNLGTVPTRIQHTTCWYFNRQHKAFRNWATHIHWSFILFSKPLVVVLIFHFSHAVKLPSFMQ